MFKFLKFHDKRSELQKLLDAAWVNVEANWRINEFFAANKDWWPAGGAEAGTVNWAPVLDECWPAATKFLTALSSPAVNAELAKAPWSTVERAHEYFHSGWLTEHPESLKSDRGWLRWIYLAPVCVAPLAAFIWLLWAISGWLFVPLFLYGWKWIGELLDYGIELADSLNDVTSRIKSNFIRYGFQYVERLRTGLNLSSRKYAVPYLVQQLEARYVREKPVRDAASAAQTAANECAKAARIEARAAVYREERDEAFEEARAAGYQGAAQTFYYEYDDRRDYEYAASSSAHHHMQEPDTQVYPSVNPANGLPMMDHTPFDVGGHVFGTNDY